MMRNKTCLVLFLWILTLHIGVRGAVNDIELRIERVLELGKNELMFASIASVCEDPDSNFYVLDRMEHRVYKFSPEGQLLQTFGQKGQGPGDFQNPRLLAFTPDKQLVVADEMHNLSFLSQDGNFIERIHLDGRLAVSLIGKNRFYAWIWQQGSKAQVMVDRQNNILKKFFQVPTSAFSVSAPDESGRRVMFNFSRDEFAPSLEFSHFGRHSAVGIGNKYDILILDEKGTTVCHIRRDILPDSFSKKEKRDFEMDIEDLGKDRGWPRRVIRDLITIIPDKKIFFDRVLLTDRHVFVFRIKKDITEKDAPVPVDVFSIKGEFLGIARMPDEPLHITQNHLYFVRSDEEDNLFLEKATYKIIVK